MRALALRNLVLVVRENEVEPAAMDVEGLAELGLAHRRAFDMPARPAAAPRAVPTGLVGGRGFPEHKIAGVALIGRDLDPGAGDHLVAAAARELAVARPGGDREQHMPLGGIGVLRRNQPLDQGDHLRDVGGGAGLDIGRQGAERRHIGVKLGRGAPGQRVDCLTGLARGGDDLVLDIGDVADIADVIRAVSVAQHAIQQIEGNDRAAIADMRQVIDGRAADIHPDQPRIDRLERLLAAGQRVVKDKRHQAVSLWDGLSGAVTRS